MNEILLNVLVVVVRCSLSEQQKINGTLKAEVNMLQTNLEELKKLNNTLFDEHTALQLAFTALEEKMRGVQVRCLVHPILGLWTLVQLPRQSRPEPPRLEDDGG